MAHDPRDALWEAIFETYYDAYYNEIVADTLIGKWQFLDGCTKVLVALTTSGSAVAGWTLWTKPEFQQTWVCLAGFAAILSIVHAKLSVAERLNDAGEIRRAFVSLRVDLETCRQCMRVDPEFSIDSFTSELKEFRRRYGDCEERIKNDLLRTNRLKKQAQAELDERLQADMAVEQ